MIIAPGYVQELCKPHVCVLTWGVFLVFWRHKPLEMQTCKQGQGPYLMIICNTMKRFSHKHKNNPMQKIFIHADTHPCVCHVCCIFLCTLRDEAYYQSAASFHFWNLKTILSLLVEVLQSWLDCLEPLISSYGQSCDCRPLALPSLSYRGISGTSPHLWSESKGTPKGLMLSEGRGMWD